MSKMHYEFSCPNCGYELKIEFISRYVPYTIKTICEKCYHPLSFHPKEKVAEIRMELLRKTAFLIHSAKPEDKTLLDWLRGVLVLYGISTKIIEEDPRSVDWLQKSLDGINSTQFVLVFLTKRYQYMNESGRLIGWKAPDKCYDEIAISFALGKDIYALGEKQVDLGRVLETRAWCYRFERDHEAHIDIEFFAKLDSYVGNI